MSETDDTDELLLIPPDFFVNEFEIFEAATPYLDIVDNLITEVHDLRDRVYTIESSDLISLNSFTMENVRKYNSSDDINIYSTPSKNRGKFKVNSLPSTPNSISPQKPIKTRNNFTITNRQQMLKEIDDFITRKESSVCTRLEYDDSSSKDTLSVGGKTINLKEIDNMMVELELQKRQTEQRLRNTENSVLNCKQLLSKRLDTSDTSNKSESGLGDQSCGSSSSSESTQITTRQNNPKGKSRNVQEVHHTEISNTEYDGSVKSVKLLSLKELWGNHGDESLTEKYKEEKFRRQHCEQLIQELQSRVLELQERLAVAVQVDHAKDKAILKFHDAWEQISIRLKSLVKERDSLENELKELQCRSVSDLAETAKKIAHYENEASKALTLAHSNQEKLEYLEKINKELNHQLNEAKKSATSSEKKYTSEANKNKQLNEIIVQKEIDLKEAKTLVMESRKEVAHSKNAIDSCQNELANIKQQYSQMEMLLQNKQEVIKDHEVQKINLLSDIENLKALNKNAENELQNMKDQLEHNKIDLRNFYQQQVELVVRDKLKEFQGELDKAEIAFQDEIKNRELAIAKTAAVHIQQIAEKHNLEIDLLEKKHQEEINLYHMQVSQSHQQIQQLQNKLKQLNERRSSVAKQLHKVMEAQWLEALKIINSSRSPSQDSTLDQLNSLKSKSHSNLDEVLSADEEKKQLPQQSTTSLINLANYEIGETPVTSKVRNRQSENDLQKYVQLLLNRQPVNKLDVEALDDKSGKSEGSEKDNWIADSVTSEGNIRASSSSLHYRKTSKPPWK